MVTDTAFVTTGTQFHNSEGPQAAAVRPCPKGRLDAGRREVKQVR